jgi:hypothetical protein
MKEQFESGQESEIPTIQPDEVALSGLQKSYAGFRYGVRKTTPTHITEFGFGTLLEGQKQPEYNGRKYGIRKNGRVILSFGPLVS